jgi:hypothetical protein
MDVDDLRQFEKHRRFRHANIAGDRYFLGSAVM